VAKPHRKINGRERTIKTVSDSCRSCHGAAAPVTARPQHHKKKRVSLIIAGVNANALCVAAQLSGPPDGLARQNARRNAKLVQIDHQQYVGDSNTTAPDCTVS